MDYLEFPCSECQCGLRIRTEHREKWIRCPNCQAVQQYRPPAKQQVGDKATPPAPAWQPKPFADGGWSLRLPDGTIINDLGRQDIEEGIRLGKLGPETWFRGGDFPDWTPLDRLFQSQVGKAGVAGLAPPAGTWIQPSLATRAPSPPSAAPPVGVAASAGHYAGPYTATPYTAPAPRLEDQLPSSNAGWILGLGIASVCLPCCPLFGLIGLIWGVWDAINIGNGRYSSNNSTMLAIGLVLSLLGLALSGCLSIRIGA
jgi:hypothetical protein